MQLATTAMRDNVPTCSNGTGPFTPLLPDDAALVSERLLGAGKCAFITAGPRSYLPAMSCIAKRLTELNSQYPLLTMVQPEDLEYMREHLYRHTHPDSLVLPWCEFPFTASAKTVGSEQTIAGC